MRPRYFDYNDPKPQHTKEERDDMLKPKLNGINSSPKRHKKELIKAMKIVQLHDIAVSVKPYTYLVSV